MNQSPFKTMADVRAANKALGNHWFDTETMKWWKTCIESSLIAGRYFITSEDEFALDGSVPKRIFAVRYANDNGSIETLKSHLRSKDVAKDYINDYKLELKKAI